MKKLGFCFSVMCLLSFVSAKAFAEPMYGVLMVVKGLVKIQNNQQQTTDAKVGSKVLEGDLVTTGPDSRAKIVMSDRNVINLNPDTQMQIAKYENDTGSGKKNVELNLLKGKVRNNVEQTYDGEKNKFLIKTPTAVAGVRGTQFLASFDVKTKMTSVVTFKGAVSVASLNAQGRVIGAPVLVKKGEMTQSAPNTPPEPPKSVPKEDMKKMDGDSTASLNNKEAPVADQKREVSSETKETAKENPKEKAPAAATTMIDSKDMDTKALADGIKLVTTTAPPVMVTPPPSVGTTPTPPPIPSNQKNRSIKVVPVISTSP